MKNFSTNSPQLTTPVKNFMTKHPYILKLTDSLEKAINIMVFNKVGSIIIVNDEKKPINILTKTDILKLLFFKQTNVSIKKALKKLKKEKKKILTINENASITDCIETFISSGIKYLPVVNGKGKVAGIISSNDIIHNFSYLIFIDNLTKLGNRHYLESVKVKLNKLQNRITTGILMLDIDNFKKVNDTYGHTLGDKVLRKTAETIINNVRFIDEVIRCGGEEFLVILLKAHKEVVLKIGERIRKAIKNIRFKGQPELQITVSIGATLCSSDCKLEDCIKRADFALKKAKREGKDRVVFTPPHIRTVKRQINFGYMSQKLRYSYKNCFYHQFKNYKNCFRLHSQTT